MTSYARTLNSDQINQFNQDGYLIIPHFFNVEQVKKLYTFATQDEAIGKHAYGMLDKEGRASKLALWFNPGNDPFGLLARSESIVGAVNQLLEGESSVAHYHSKLMQKEPHVGGAWEWHQDYGYWHRAQFPFPDQMMSVMTALTEATPENGCLQVIKGSHKMGRIQHAHEGHQMGADMAYVEQALEYLTHEYVVLQPGDILLFHSNLLHRSEANRSANPRWSFISAYNRTANVPKKEKSTACTTPIETVPDRALLEAEWVSVNDGMDFLSADKDVNIQ
jgi:ectoine hydroxylase-related dioxygenase (phytanoyl-CoA dioxygenase family)